MAAERHYDNNFKDFTYNDFTYNINQWDIDNIYILYLLSYKKLFISKNCYK
jgi:hypothetical protein